MTQGPENGRDRRGFLSTRFYASPTQCTPCAETLVYAFDHLNPNSLGPDRRASPSRTCTRVTDAISAECPDCHPENLEMGISDDRIPLFSARAGIVTNRCHRFRAYRSMIVQIAQQHPPRVQLARGDEMRVSRGDPSLVPSCSRPGVPGIRSRAIR